jgi:Sigma-54 interaction domain
MELFTPFPAHSAASSTVFELGLRLPDDWRRACTAHHDLQGLGMPRVNMLFIGANEAAWQVLRPQLPLAAPIAVWHPGDPLDLPVPAGTKTLVLREIGRLAEADQVRLLDWLDAGATGTQVVCTTSRSLMPQLEQGTFISALYYRLNIVCVDLTA